ncbi:hypothetical protein AVEN_189269-1 [Araneus ventricosus]|uniref:Uncharacterized protein n=1 Tax=Araneus ventricosus TaxID=182803 RepID=A0A4Y2LTI9_ARAVE|nr:hypothetical protein AVEN_189269-1 [Araneus ventricosus]
MPARAGVRLRELLCGYRPYPALGEKGFHSISHEGRLKPLVVESFRERVHSFIKYSGESNRPSILSVQVDSPGGDVCLADSKFCPPSDLITPCECSTFWGSVCVKCEGLSGNEVIMDILNKTSDYGYEYFFLLQSSVQYIPASAFQIKKISGLVIYFTTMTSLFDKPPETKDLFEIEFRSLKLTRSIQWDLFTGMSNLKILTVYESPLNNIDKQFIKYAPKSLEKITIQSSSMSKLPDKAFEALTNLTEISMNYGKIKELKRNMFPSPAKIKQISFGVATWLRFAAAHQHSLKVYYQIQYWLGNKNRPGEWAWERINSELQLVKTLKSPAPDSVLNARYPASVRRGAQEIVAVGRSDCFVQCCILIVGATAITEGFKNQRIESLPEDIFKDMPDLGTVRLHENHISQIPEFKGVNVNRFFSIKLENNPIKCNCSIRWIVLKDVKLYFSGTHNCTASERSELGSRSDPKRITT